jgi:DNA-binding LacI/PurR family transcriptional regulator
MPVWKTIYNMGFEVGRESGRRESREMHRVESDNGGGAERAARELIDLLQQRFGPIAIEIRECIVSVDLKAIKVWTQATLEGRSLESIFDPHFNG